MHELKDTPNHHQMYFTKINMPHKSSLMTFFLGQSLGLCQAAMPDGSPHRHQRKESDHKAHQMK